MQKKYVEQENKLFIFANERFRSYIDYLRAVTPIKTERRCD
jgi:hypothetical protein